MPRSTVVPAKAAALLLATLTDARRPMTADEIRRASRLSKAATDTALNAMLASGALIYGTQDEARVFLLPEWVPGLEWVPARRRWRKRKLPACTPAEAVAVAAAFLAALAEKGWPMNTFELREACDVPSGSIGDALDLLKASGAVVVVEAAWHRQPYIALPEQVAAWEQSDFAARPRQRRPRPAHATQTPHA